MSVIKKWLFAICTIILMNGCAPLRMPVIVRNAPIEMYNPQIEMFARFKMKSSFHKTKRII